MIAPLPPIFVATLAFVGSAQPLPAGPKFDKAILQRLGDATVLVRVELPYGGVSQGSAFFAVEPGLLLTNAHVVGMSEPGSWPPRQIRVTIRSGRADSRTLTAKLLGVDGDNGLAVLRVTGTDLPAPLPLGSAAGLRDGQALWLLGFPVGAEPGKNVTFRQSSVAAPPGRRSGWGNKVPLSGGVHSGNTGGPVTEDSGAVIGLSGPIRPGGPGPSVITADAVRAFVGGRVQRFAASQMVRDGDRLIQPLRLYLVDPLSRIRKVSVEFWVADRKAPSGPKSPATPVRQTVALVRDATGIARGDLTVAPPTAAGQALWFRPVIVSTAGKVRRYPATALPISPLERKSVVLIFNPRPGREQSLRLNCQTSLRTRAEGGKDQALGVNLETRLAVKEELAAGAARRDVRFEELKMKSLLDGQAVRSAEGEQAAEQVRRAVVLLDLGPKGEVQKARIIVSKVPAVSRPVVTDLIAQTVDALKVIAVPLPGTEVKPQERWQVRRRVRIGPPGQEVSAVAAVTYTYLGTRARGRQTQALLELSGSLTRPQGGKQRVTGTVSGSIAVDLETGLAMSASVTLSVDADLTFEGRPAQASGVFAVQLNRPNAE